MVRHTVGWLLATVVVVACSATSQATPTPSPAALTSAPATTSMATLPPTTGGAPSQTAPPAAPEPTSLATPELTPEPTSTPGLPADEGLVIDWRMRRGDPGLGVIEEFVGIADAVVFENRFYLRGQVVDADDNYRPTIWASDNGLDWDVALQTEDFDWLRTLAATREAIVATGELDSEEAVWVSNDGNAWDVLTDTNLDSVRAMAVAQDGFVAVGSGVWTSTDGRTWNQVASQSAQDVAAARISALGTDGRNLLALTQPAEFEPISASISSDGGNEWTQPVALPGSRPYTITAITSSPFGWIVAGEGYARGEPPARTWISVDGVVWEQVPGPDRTVRDLLSTDAGLVAVGFEYVNPGCALNPADVQGFTWTSVDGRAWKLMDPEGLRFRRIEQLLRDGRTLIGVGFAYDSDEDDSGEGTVWTARLPASGEPGLGSNPRPNEGGGGCGEE